MRCPACSAKTREGDRFCGACGSDLSLPALDGSSAPRRPFQLGIALGIAGAVVLVILAFALWPRESLSGMWEGTFEAGVGAAAPTPFTAVIAQDGARISGTITEPTGVAANVQTSELAGEIDGASVAFTKTYQPSGLQIAYTGTLDRDTKTISGTWKRDAMTGGFRMAWKASAAAAPSPAPDSSPASTISSLSDNEQRSIMHGLIRLLGRRHFRTGKIYAPEMRPCTTIFSLGTTQIVDVAILGTTGKVHVAVPVTAREPIDLGRMYAKRYYYPSEHCYGAPPGGWNQGRTATSTYEVAIEKWGTGWRLSQQQTLPLVR